MKKQVYVTRNLPDVYLVRDYLQAEGIPVEIRNESLFGAQGEVPVTSDTLPSLWTEEEHEWQARELIQIHRNTDGAEGVAALDAMHSDASPEAQGAMSALFEAADRLTRGADGAQLDEVQRLGALIRGSTAPFGIESALWDRIGAHAAEVVGTQGDDHAVVAAATRLRDLLRDLV